MSRPPWASAKGTAPVRTASGNIFQASHFGLLICNAEWARWGQRISLQTLAHAHLGSSHSHAGRVGHEPSCIGPKPLTYLMVNKMAQGCFLAPHKLARSCIGGEKAPLRRLIQELPLAHCPQHLVEMVMSCCGDACQLGELHLQTQATY